jgi:hypothetical protein
MFGGADGTTLPKALKLFKINNLAKNNPVLWYIKWYTFWYIQSVAMIAPAKSISKSKFLKEDAYAR